MASLGVAVREYPTSTGPVDYALFVDGKPVGVIEAKKDELGESITTTESQSRRNISEDKELFHTLFDKKDAIESDAGLTFDWRELPERKASRIVIEKGVTFGDKSQWNAQFDWIIDVMLKTKEPYGIQRQTEGQANGSRADAGGTRAESRSYCPNRSELRAWYQKTGKYGNRSENR